MDGARSARERSASVQLKPSPVGRCDALDLSSWGATVFILAAAAPAAAERGGLRTDAEPGEDPLARAALAGCPGGGGYLPLPMLPVRASRSAWAPKETRRANGELGVAPGDALSASSPIASSALGALDPMELDRLPGRKARFPKAEVWVGEPDRPRVEIDSRRWWLVWALDPVAWGPLAGGGLFCFAKRSVKVAPKEPRRWRDWELGTEMGEVERSSDMVVDR